MAIEDGAPDGVEESQDLVECAEIEFDIAFFECHGGDAKVGVSLDAARTVDVAIHGNGAVDIAEGDGFDASEFE